MQQKILVTGGAGFIGSHLCERLLSDGHEVLSLDNFNDFYDPAIKKENIEIIETHFNRDRFKSIEGDIRNKDLVEALFDREKPTGIIHLAAMAGVRPSLQKPELYMDVNIHGTQVLLEACAKKGIKHFIFASSSSVYGNNEKVPFAETDCVDFPISPYAASKKAGELLCHVYAHLYNIKIDCLRFFTVYGPRQRPDLAIHKFSKWITEGKEIPVFGDGHTHRDYTYIDDIIDGILKSWAGNQLAGEVPRYEIFNLGESRTIELNHMIECLEETLGKKAKIKRLPMEAGDVMRTDANISKAKTLLGYSPSTDFEEGINKFIQWLQRNKEALVYK